MKKLLLLLVSVCLMFMVGCSEQNSQIAEIKKRGELRVGVKSDVPKFGYLNPATDVYEGLEIDIAKALAKSIIGDENAINFVPVTALTRDTLLSSNEIDFIIATFTITDARKETYNFTEPYYTDEIGFLTKGDSGITDVEGMEGKVVGATFSSTAYDLLESGEFDSRAVFTRKGYASYPEVKNALATGVVDVFVADKSILYGYLDEGMVMLDEGFAPQPYGIATRLSDTDFAKYIDTQLQTMKNDGSLKTIFTRWSL